MLVAVATLGTTLAPWGLAFIQSYAVDKRLDVEDLRYERVDVVAGAVLTGVIGLSSSSPAPRRCTPMACTINDASDAALALRAARRHLAATLFGLGFVGAALLAAAVVPLSTAYSVAEAFGRARRFDDGFRDAPSSTAPTARASLVAARSCSIPGAPLIPILFLSQALNAVLLLAILPFLRAPRARSGLMGEHRSAPPAPPTAATRSSSLRSSRS